MRKTLCSPQNPLRYMGEVRIPRHRKKSDPREFFMNREGLYISDDFRCQILPAVSPVKLVRMVSLPVFELTKSLTDEEICTELGDGHVFEDASVFCEHLKDILTRQKNGESGDLPKNGYATIFYVRGINRAIFSVRISRDADYREWDVDAYRLGKYLCFTGYRVLSATACPPTCLPADRILRRKRAGA